MRVRVFVFCLYIAAEPILCVTVCLFGCRVCRFGETRFLVGSLLFLLTWFYRFFLNSRRSRSPELLDNDYYDTSAAGTNTTV